MLGSLLELDCTFTYVLSWTLTVPSLSWSLWLLPVFKTRTTGKTLTHYQIQQPVQGINMALGGSQLLCADPNETLPRRSCLNNAGLFLIIEGSPTSADQYWLSQQRKFHFNSSGLWLNIANSSVSPDQNHRLFYYLFLFYVNDCFCMYVLAWCSRKSKEGTKSPGTGMVVSCPVGTRDQT